MARIPNLSASTDSYVRTITHLKDQPRGDEALDMLKRVASLAKPIMRKRNWHLPTLGEFLPNDPNLLGACCASRASIIPFDTDPSPSNDIRNQ